MRRNPWGLLPLFLAAGACAPDVRVEGEAFVCADDSDCLVGYVCAAPPGMSRTLCVVAGAAFLVDAGSSDTAPGCLPACDGRECGPDGCGGSCGECGVGVLCSSSGQCVCTPKCQDKTCGSDGCGGSCGTCSPPEVCGTDTCVLGTELPHCTGGSCFVPAGSFIMGSLGTEACRFTDEGRHDVRLTRSLWVQDVEVQQAAWDALFEADPSAHFDCPSCPVDRVTFWDALAYANQRSSIDGFVPCYALSGCSGTVGIDYACTGVSFTGPECRGYRLPTEAEWEYAARAGAATAYPDASGSEKACASCSVGEGALAPYGWYCTNSKDASHPGGEKQPNAWGLYDMHGNVWEWVWDIYAPYTLEGTSVNPTGAVSGEKRCLRGGAFTEYAGAARSANRESAPPGERSKDAGLRLVRTHY